MDHFGFVKGVEDPNWLALLSLAEFPQVCVKASAQFRVAPEGERWPYESTGPQLRGLLDAFGPERVVWGSDFPYVEEQCGYERASEIVGNCGAALSAEEAEAVMGGNLARMFPGGGVVVIELFVNFGNASRHTGSQNHERAVSSENDLSVLTARGSRDGRRRRLRRALRVLEQTRGSSMYAAVERVLAARPDWTSASSASSFDLLIAERWAIPHTRLGRDGFGGTPSRVPMTNHARGSKAITVKGMMVKSLRALSETVHGANVADFLPETYLVTPGEASDAAERAALLRAPARRRRVLDMQAHGRRARRGDRDMQGRARRAAPRRRLSPVLRDG